MTLELLALGVWYTLCGVASVVVYIALATLFHAKLASKWSNESSDPEFDRFMMVAVWPITGLIAGIGAFCASMYRSLSGLPKPAVEVPETEPPESVTCDMCREELKRGTYR